MQPSIQPKREPRHHRQSCRWMMIVVACICVWRGPIPVLHCHSLALDTMASNPLLAGHAVHFHAEEVGQPDSGLHLHFILLNGCQGSLFCEHQGSPANCQVGQTLPPFSIEHSGIELSRLVQVDQSSALAFGSIVDQPYCGRTKLSTNSSSRSVSWMESRPKIAVLGVAHI